MLGVKREEIKGEWIMLHNEELYVLYCSTNSIWLMKWRRIIRWAEHVACMGG